jgi:phosphoribosylaminoimidazole-succinocarboxamide synthase
MPSLRTHFISLDLPESIKDPDLRSRYSHRSMQVRSLEVIPLESIVRGCRLASPSPCSLADLEDLTGSAFSEYQRSRTVHGIAMPAGLRESEKLEQPLWTPSTKAEKGENDENISPSRGLDFYWP